VTGPPPLNGLLIIDKPAGITSMQVCRIIKSRLIKGGFPKRVKVGHAGTLDPLATGVLVVLIGRATKLCDSLMAGEKRYTAEIDLSRTSSTDDREGTLTELPGLIPPSLEQLRAACATFVGTIQQRPPAHSAIWVDGERAYKLARKADKGRGEAVTLPARPVTIHEITVLNYGWPLAELDIRCGKGTYIRSLARDLGASLGIGGMLVNLRRTSSLPFHIDRAVPPESLPEALGQADLLNPADFAS
jgi:tRNA pseudouridine55 synthase